MNKVGEGRVLMLGDSFLEADERVPDLLGFTFPFSISFTLR